MNNRRPEGASKPLSSAMCEAHALDQEDLEFNVGGESSPHYERDSSGSASGTLLQRRIWIEAVAKRAMDIQISVTLLLLLSPLLIVMGLAVMADGGSPVFGHQRIGRGGRQFKCLKFRSMVRHADKVLEELLATDPEARREWNREFKLKNDVRVTKFGRMLRSTSLDELPQLWNVLLGQMSLVGPRPIVEKELLKYGGDVHYYLAVKPGMTGLWQVSGRNNVDYATRVALDVRYVKTRSFATDLTILLRTFKVVLARDGAY
jgi:lipopolysaccharide/colanic/teichoic acid biosynthesis glycosyltransferase